MEVGPRPDAGTAPRDSGFDDGGLVASPCGAFSELTVCDLKLASSPRHPALGSTVSVIELGVTALFAPSTSVSGFFVQDLRTTASSNGRYSGILVTYPTTAPILPPSVGDVVEVDGTTIDVLGQLQISATAVRTVRSALVDPTVADPLLISTGGADAEALEGALVEVRGVTVASTDVMVGGSSVFGAIQVDGGLIISNSARVLPTVAVGERFLSIRGVLRRGTAAYEAGASLLTPRAASDVELETQATVARNLAVLLDPAAPGYSAGCSNPDGTAVVGRCVQVELSGLIVTASGGYVSNNLRSLWVQDPSDSDRRFAGIKVVYNRNQLLDVPVAGERVDVLGEAIEYRGGMQIQYPTITRLGSATPIDPAEVDPFDLGQSSVSARAYAGSLVRIRNVSVTTPCVADELDRDHGEWVVTGGVSIGTAFDYTYNGDIRPSGVICVDGSGLPTGACSCAARSRPNDLRTLGDLFTALTGVLDFSFGAYHLEPRGDFDLER